MKKVFSILSDADFSPEMLSIRLGNYHVSFAVSNREGTELVQLAYFTNSSIITDAELQQIWLQESLLQKNFSLIKIAIDLPYAIVVPHKFSENFATAEAMQCQYGPMVASRYLTDALPNWQLNIQYAVPQTLLNFLQERMPQAEIRHGYTTDISRIIATDFEGAIRVDFRSEEFSLIASRSNKLLLTQIFTYENPADVIYYLLQVARQFGFTQQELRLTVSGLIEQESSLYRELHHYFLNIRFHNAEWVYRSENEPLPAHFFTALYDLAQCG